MAFTRKSATLVNRVDGDLPTLPDNASEDMREWWSEFTEVFERVRSNTTDGNAFSDAERSKLSQTQIYTLDEKLKLEGLSNQQTSSSPVRQTVALPSNQFAVGTQQTSQRFLFTASTNESQWTINHNLGFYPNVQVYDSDYDEIFADIRHPSTIQTLVNFTGTTTGYAVLS